MAENYCKKFFELPTIPVQDITTEELAVRLYYMYMCMRGQMQEMHAAVKAVAPDHKFSPDLEAALAMTVPLPSRTHMPVSSLRYQSGMTSPSLTGLPSG